METQTIPSIVTQVLHKKVELGGGLFSRKRDEPFQEYLVIDWKWASAQIFDMKTLKPIHPTVRFLVKNDQMKRSRWTLPFACTDIKVEDE